MTRLVFALAVALAFASSASALTLRTRAFIVGDTGTAVCWFHNVSGAAKTAQGELVNLSVGTGDTVSETCTAAAAGAGCSLGIGIKGPTPVYCQVTVDAKAAEVRGGALLVDGSGASILSLDAN